MSLSGADRDRLSRLAGSGKGWGGGLPLPLLFDAVFSELLDEGSATTERLTEITKDKLEFKANQVITNQAMGGPRADAPDWGALTMDVVDQMVSRRLVTRVGEDWATGPGFAAGQSLTVIPAGERGKRPAYTVTVWARGEREALSRASKAESEAMSLVARPNPVNREVVARLRESFDRYGGQYKILTTADGRVIDGHHRDEAHPEWPKDVAKKRDGTDITTTAEALALIAELDIRRPPMDKKTRQNVERILGELASTNHVKRDRIEAELKRDATRSNRLIAETVGGVSYELVGSVRQHLTDSVKCHAYVFTTARIGKHSADCWCGEGDAEVKTKTPSKAEQRQQDIDRQVAPRLARGETQTEIGRALGLGDSGQSTSLAKAVGRYEGATGKAPWVEPPASKQQAAAPGTPSDTRATPTPATPVPESVADDEHDDREDVVVQRCRKCGKWFLPD